MDSDNGLTDPRSWSFLVGEGIQSSNQKVDVVYYSLMVIRLMYPQNSSLLVGKETLSHYAFRLTLLTVFNLWMLDVECFGPLDKAYKGELERRSSLGVVEIDKAEFLILLKEARENTLTQAVIMPAWAAAGIMTIRF